MTEGASFLVPLMPRSLRRWQYRGGWGLLALSVAPIGWGWSHRGDAQDIAVAVAISAPLLFVAGMVFVARSYDITWEIDPISKSATRRRSFLGLKRETAYAAGDLRGIRVWFQESPRETYGSDMYVAGFTGSGRGDGRGLMLTSGYRAGEVRRIAAAVGEQLGLPVSDTQ